MGKLDRVGVDARRPGLIYLTPLLVAIRRPTQRTYFTVTVSFMFMARCGVQMM